MQINFWLTFDICARPGQQPFAISINQSKHYASPNYISNIRTCVYDGCTLYNIPDNRLAIGQLLVCTNMCQ
jgi:hypothetical protein